MLKKIEEYYRGKGFKDDVFELKYNNEDIIECIEKDKTTKSIKINKLERVALFKEDTKYVTFANLDFDLNITEEDIENFHKSTCNFSRHRNKEEVLGFIKEDIFDNLKHIIVSTFNTVKNKNKARHSNGILIVFLKKNNSITERFIRDLNNNTSTTRINVILYNEEKEILSYLEDKENKTIKNIDSNEYDLFFKLPLIEEKQNLYQRIIDVMKKDKDYIIERDDIINSFNKYKSLYNYVLTLLSIDNIEELDISIDKEISLTNHIYFNRKRIYSICILLTTLLEDKYDNIIYDFFGLQEDLLPLINLFKLFDKNLIFYSYNREGEIYYIYQLSKVGYENKRE